MGKAVIFESGQRVGNLVVLRFNGWKNGERRYLCRCACGKEFDTAAWYLNSKKRQAHACNSCLRKKTWEPAFLGDTCVIPLTSGVGTEALIDAEDYERVKDYSWRSVYGYVQHSVRGKKAIMLSRLIMGVVEDKGWRRIVVDHINHDTLDNRKQNLRIATYAQNNWNRVKKVKGYSKQGRYYVVTLWADEMRHTYYTKSEEEATEVRKQAEIKYHGEYRPR